MMRWFWSRRDHGYRGRGMCRRCGDYEFSDRHPRGMWGLARWWNVR